MFKEFKTIRNFAIFNCSKYDKSPSKISYSLEMSLDDNYYYYFHGDDASQYSLICFNILCEDDITGSFNTAVGFAKKFHMDSFIWAYKYYNGVDGYSLWLDYYENIGGDDFTFKNSATKTVHGFFDVNCAKEFNAIAKQLSIGFSYNDIFELSGRVGLYHEKALLVKDHAPDKDNIAKLIDEALGYRVSPNNRLTVRRSLYYYYQWDDTHYDEIYQGIFWLKSASTDDIKNGDFSLECVNVLSNIHGHTIDESDLAIIDCPTIAWSQI